MKKQKISLTIFSVSIFLSLLGWFNYARFVYITSVEPDLSIAEYDKKYFANYPIWLRSIDKVNLATVIILILAILLIIISGYLNRKSKIIAYIILILDGILTGMVFLAYM